MLNYSKIKDLIKASVLRYMPCGSVVEFFHFSDLFGLSGLSGFFSLSGFSRLSGLKEAQGMGHGAYGTHLVYFINR